MSTKDTTTQRTATEILDNLVGHVVAQEGVSEQAARERVLKDCPDLRERMVAEANVGQPARGTRARPDLAGKAAAYDGIPRFGRPVE